MSKSSAYPRHLGEVIYAGGQLPKLRLSGDPRRLMTVLLRSARPQYNYAIGTPEDVKLTREARAPDIATALQSLETAGYIEIVHLAGPAARAWAARMAQCELTGWSPTRARYIRLKWAHGPLEQALQLGRINLEQDQQRSQLLLDWCGKTGGPVGAFTAGSMEHLETHLGPDVIILPEGNGWGRTCKLHFGPDCVLATISGNNYQKRYPYADPGMLDGLVEWCQEADTVLWSSYVDAYSLRSRELAKTFAQVLKQRAAEQQAEILRCINPASITAENEEDQLLEIVEDADGKLPYQCSKLILTNDERAPWRFSRLQRVLGYIANPDEQILEKIAGVKDLKGCLTVTWWNHPTQQAKALCERAWGSMVIGDGNPQIIHELVPDLSTATW